MKQIKRQMLSHLTTKNTGNLSIVAALLLFAATIFAQPLYNSKQTIEGRDVYKDIKAKNKYYYAPGPLSLSTDKDDRPVFQLLSMRYTGSGLTNDRDEKRFTNLLLFSVRMEALTTERKQAIKAALPAGAQLQPLPIRHLEAVVVSGVGKPGTDEGRMRKHATSQQDNPDAPGEYWTERSFTLPLDNHDAQILWDQVENGRLIVSLNYAFYANLLQIQAETLEVSGDSAFVQQMTDAVSQIERDTPTVSCTVRANALEIGIDAKKYPELLKKIDINETSIPPAYAAFEVKCFDFNLGVRPDIAFKTVEIEGESVTGTPVRTKTKFSYKQPDIITRYASFPYAVRMDRPIRYRVVETPFESDPKPAQWKVMEQFSNLIDASSLQKKNPLSTRCIDAEILPEYMADKNLEAATVHIVFQFAGQKRLQSIVFNKENAQFFGSTCITFDQGTAVQYMVARKFKDGRKTKGILRNIGKDDYVLVR
jgi:hypothetical protein